MCAWAFTILVASTLVHDNKLIEYGEFFFKFYFRAKLNIIFLTNINLNFTLLLS